MEVRKGRQTPTTSVVLPYDTSLGQEAIDLYEKTDRSAMEWQQLLIRDIMARNADGLWTHSKFGYAVPRRNGKNALPSFPQKKERCSFTKHLTNCAPR